MIHSIVSFKKIPFQKLDNTKLPVGYTIPVRDENGSDVFVRICPRYVKDDFKTSIDSSDFKNLARNEFSIDYEKRVIKNGGMDVWSKDDRGKGLGIILHLNSIMELFENDLEKIKLYSMGEAVFFHSKCMFEPDLSGKDEIVETLYAISQKDCSHREELKEPVRLAGEYFDEIQYTSGFYCLNKEKLKYANSIIQKYIEAVKKQDMNSFEKEEYGFQIGFDMVLTKEKILENKDFFNGLFKKFDIDYEI